MGDGDEEFDVGDVVGDVLLNEEKKAFDLSMPIKSLIFQPT